MGYSPRNALPKTLFNPGATALSVRLAFEQELEDAISKGIDLNGTDILSNKRNMIYILKKHEEKQKIIKMFDNIAQAVGKLDLLMNANPELYTNILLVFKQIVLPFYTYTNNAYNNATNPRFCIESFVDILSDYFKNLYDSLGAARQQQKQQHKQ